MVRKIAVLLVFSVVIVTLTGCRNMGRREWGSIIGGTAGAATGAVLGGEEHRLTGAIIGGAIGAGGGYLIGSHLDKEEQREVMQEYNILIQMRNEKQVEEGIDRLADETLGNGNGVVSTEEKSRALEALRDAMAKAADQLGNNDGVASPEERRNYLDNYSDRPLLDKLTTES